MVTDKKKQESKLEVASDAKAIAYVASRVNNRRLNCFCMTAENSKLWRRLNDLDGKLAKQ